jgi:hypothetical protein
MDTCTKKLVEALETLPQSFNRDELIRRAKKDRFHDFKSDSATPCVDLVMQLRAAGFEEMAKRAMEGEFDAGREESEAWAQSPEGIETFNQLLGGRGRSDG